MRICGCLCVTPVQARQTPSDATDPCLLYCAIHATVLDSLGDMHHADEFSARLATNFTCATSVRRRRLPTITNSPLQSDWRCQLRTVFPDRVVRRASSHDDIPSWKCTRLILTNTPMLITPRSTNVAVLARLRRALRFRHGVDRNEYVSRPPLFRS